MSAPTANDLFMNVWVSRINSEEMAQPGDPEWDSGKMNRFWGKVWIQCKELSMHLQAIENASEKFSEIMKEGADTPVQQQQQAEDIADDLLRE